MKREEQIKQLNQILLTELPQYQAQAKQVPKDTLSQRSLLRGLMNLRPSMPLRQDYLTFQDELLSEEREEKGIIHVEDLPATADPRIVLWQGDITRLAADAIVNAANSGMTGCYRPNHNCIDNAILFQITHRFISFLRGNVCFTLCLLFRRLMKQPHLMNN